jgi:hypothetical protein
MKILQMILGMEKICPTNQLKIYEPRRIRKDFYK